MKSQVQSFGLSGRGDRTIPPAVGLMMAGSVSLMLWAAIAGIIVIL